MALLIGRRSWHKRKIHYALIASVVSGSALTHSAVAHAADVAPTDLTFIRKEPIIVVSRWDGAYASASFGATSLRAQTDHSSISNSNSTSTTSTTSTSTSPFFPTTTSTSSFSSASNSSTTIVDTASGRDIDPALAFTMGYNATSNNWLAGIQSEINFNLAQPRLTGTSSGTNGNGSSFQSNSQGFNSSSSSSNSTTANGTIEYQLRNYWTVSVMARLGVLVTREWLAYGLIGWSVSRFNPVWGSGSSCQSPSPTFFLAQLPTTGCIPTFTASGITLGGGIERDFGWIRAFVQFKYINYGGKDFVTNSTNTSPSSSTSQFSVQSFSSNSVTTGSSSSSFADRLSLSANQIFLTTGVTLPLN